MAILLLRSYKISENDVEKEIEKEVEEKIDEYKRKLIQKLGPEIEKEVHKKIGELRESVEKKIDEEIVEDVKEIADDRVLDVLMSAGSKQPKSAKDFAHKIKEQIIKIRRTSLLDKLKALFKRIESPNNPFLSKLVGEVEKCWQDICKIITILFFVSYGIDLLLMLMCSIFDLPFCLTSNFAGGVVYIVIVSLIVFVLSLVLSILVRESKIGIIWSLILTIPLIVIVISVIIGYIIS